MARALTLFVFYSFCLINNAFCQFNDDFSDGDFQNPTWQGDTLLYELTNGNLHQDAPAVSGSTILYTLSNAADNVRWSIDISLLFNPSSANYTEIFIIADQLNNPNTVNGYAVRIGTTSDDIDLLKYTNGNSTVLVDGLDDLVDQNNVHVQIQVLRQNDVFTLTADTSNSFNHPMVLGSSSDLTYTSSQFFGIYNTYTATRSDKFIFDNIDIDLIPVTDTIPPQITVITPLNLQELILEFNEPIQVPSTAQFNIPGLGQANNLLHQSNQVTLSFLSLVTAGHQYTIQCTQISDTANNSVALISEDFAWNYSPTPTYEDIVINEFMPDPTPALVYPESEYVELYNVSNHTYNLANYTLGDASGWSSPVDSFWLEPNAYVVLYNQNDSALWNIPNGLGIENWKTLNNAGDQIKLRDAQFNIIDSIEYTDEWYGPSYTEEGGWSIEKIHPSYPCNDPNNFTVSQDPNQATPGTINSVYDTVPSGQGPQFIQYQFVNHNVLVLEFSKELNPNSQPQLTWLQGTPPDTASFQLNQITCKWNLPVDSTTVFELLFNTSDCAGQSETDTITFALGIVPQKGNIVFSEIAGVPLTELGYPEVEWIEIKNTTDSPIQLQGLTLNDSSAYGTFSQSILWPNAYLIVSESTWEHHPHYVIDNLPNISNTTEDLWLQFNQQIIDELHYTNWNFEENTYQKQHTNDLCVNFSDFIPQKATPASENIDFVNRNAPFSLSTTIYDSSKIALQFSHRLSPIQSPQYWISDDTISNYIARYDSLVLTTQWYPKFNLYTDSLLLCNQNPKSIDVEIKSIDAGMVVINEILYNPVTGGADFIEIYNNDDVAHSTQQWQLAHLSSEDTVWKPLTDSSIWIEPGEFWVFTEDPENIATVYHHTDMNKVVGSDLPSFNDDYGTVWLRHEVDGTIDSVSYNDDWQFPLLKSTEGISLERSFYNEDSNVSENWHSAAETNGYGTPTQINSQSQAIDSLATLSVTLAYSSFSPNNDGFRDFLTIFTQFEDPETTLSLAVYDMNGLKRAVITQQELVGKKQTYTWNGLSENGAILPIGVYLVWVEYFTINGKTEQHQLPFSLVD